MITLTVKVSEGTMLKESIASFVESMGEQLVEFLEVLTEEEDEELSVEQYQELCKDIKIDTLTNSSKYKRNKIGFLRKEI